MDKFQVLTWNVFNRFILRNEKVAYQVNPGEVLILDHAHDRYGSLWLGSQNATAKR